MPRRSRESGNPGLALQQYVVSKIIGPGSLLSQGRRLRVPPFIGKTDQWGSNRDHK